MSDACLRPHVTRRRVRTSEASNASIGTNRPGVSRCGSQSGDDDGSRPSCRKRADRTAPTRPWISGGCPDRRYLEAGDGGRLRVSAGHVVGHEVFSAHRNDFGPSGAYVLNLPLPAGFGEQVGTVEDLDAIARLAETDFLAAADLTLERFLAVDACTEDWPDLLAAALTGNPDLQLAACADMQGIAASSLSRGFLAAYGVSPKRFRLEQRTRRALRELPTWSGTLAGLAAKAGFADQAHFTRLARDLTGMTPDPALSFVVDPLSLTRIDRTPGGWRICTVNSCG